MKIAFNALFKLLLIILLFPCSKGFAQQKTDTTIENRVFSIVEIEASFPGGDSAWTKYIYNVLIVEAGNFKNSDVGTCRVRFIVDKTGHVSDVKALTMKRSRLAKVVVEAIENGPKWNPAFQDGRFVNAFREQPVTFAFSK